MDEYSRFIDELKQRANIVDLVEQYSQVQRRGSRYFACCPLHVEKTPSFCIYPDSNSYYCFGCHKQGDAFTLIEEMEKTDFKGAVEYLAKRYNMEIPEFKGDASLRQAKKKRDRLYELTKETATHYYNNLMSDKGKEAREYLASRGLDANTIRNFGLGFSIDKFDLPKHLKSKGFTVDEMVEAKVAYSTKQGVYDPQFGRFVTPILNSTRNVVAFGGRILGKKVDGVGKYYNSSDSFIFHKSNELFGQHIVKNLRNIDNVVLVEGYMDVISLYQAGIHNAVASMGTALTKEQAHIITRYAKKVYFMYDGDEAGQKGMLRGVDILKAEGLDVKVVVLEDNLDPDEYIKKFGAEAMKQKIYSGAIPMYEYKIKDVEKNYNLKSPEERGEFASKAVECIKDIPSKAQAEPLINYIQAKSGISQQTLFELFSSVQQGKEIKAPTLKTKIANDNTSKALRFIIYAAYGGIDGVVVKDEYANCIDDENMKALYENFRLHQGDLTIEDLENQIDDNPEVKPILDYAKQIGDKVAKKHFYDSRRQVLLTYCEKRKRELFVQMAETENGIERNELLVQFDELQKYIDSIKQGKMEV